MALILLNFCLSNCGQFVVICTLAAAYFDKDNDQQDNYCDKHAADDVANIFFVIPFLVLISQITGILLNQLVIVKLFVYPAFI